MTIMNMVGGGGGGDTPTFFSYSNGIHLRSGIKYASSLTHLAGTKVNTAVYSPISLFTFTPEGKIASMETASSTEHYAGKVTASMDMVLSSTDISADVVMDEGSYNELSDSGEVVFIVSLNEYGYREKAMVPRYEQPTYFKGLYNKIGNNTISVIAPIGGKTIAEIFGKTPSVYGTSSFTSSVNSELFLSVYKLGV